MNEANWMTAVAQELMVSTRSIKLIVAAAQRAGAQITPAELIAAGAVSPDTLYLPPDAGSAGTKPAQATTGPSGTSPTSSTTGASRANPAGTATGAAPANSAPSGGPPEIGAAEGSGTPERSGGQEPRSAQDAPELPRRGWSRLRRHPEH